MKVDVLLGLQWGDEGKGKIVDVLAPNYDVVARFHNFSLSFVTPLKAQQYIYFHLRLAVNDF